MRTICDDLKARTTHIIALWERTIEAEPWIVPRQHARADFIPEIVNAIADCVLCSPPTRRAVLALAETAARHASARAAEGADHGRLVLEYYLLRNALWTFCREQHGEGPGELSAILYVDVAISMATRAALLGYYRREMEARDRWEGALERLVDEAPLMWAAG